MAIEQTQCLQTTRFLVSYPDHSFFTWSLVKSLEARVEVHRSPSMVILWDLEYQPENKFVGGVALGEHGSCTDS